MGKPKHPFCHVCGWRKGGVDSWDGRACKCGLSEPAMRHCERCNGIGTVPHDIGQRACPKCSGSGLVAAVYAERVRA